MPDRPESRVRSVPVADVLTREGRDDPADRRRAEFPRRVLKTAAGAAVVVGALWGLHDQFTPESTGVSADTGRSSPFTEAAAQPSTAATAVVGPQVAVGEVVTTATPQAPPAATTAREPQVQASPETTKRNRPAVPNPVQVIIDVARRLGGG